MECRICHQALVFVRGRFPHRSKTTTLAVHENEAASLLQHPNSFVTNPHPGAQRKLRAALEAEHHATPATNHQLEDKQPAPTSENQAPEQFTESAQDTDSAAEPDRAQEPDRTTESDRTTEHDRAAVATNTFE